MVKFEAHPVFSLVCDLFFSLGCSHRSLSFNFIHYTMRRTNVSYPNPDIPGIR